MLLRKMILARTESSAYSVLSSVCCRRGYQVTRVTTIGHRSLSDTTSMKVFDRATKRQQRDRAAAADPEGRYDYLREHIAAALVDRIEVGECRREAPRTAVLGLAE